MAGFLNKLKSSGGGTASQTSHVLPGKKSKDEPPAELTPLEKMLQNAGPLRGDGSDKFFGMENFGNTCYCNSIVQALFYSVTFRENVVNYPPLTPSDNPHGQSSKFNIQIRPPMAATTPAKQKQLSASQALKQRQAINSGQIIPGQQGVRPEDKPDSPEYKKKQAMIKGPVLELSNENGSPYGMDECTFTGLKDIFRAMIESSTRTGVISPQRFLEIFKRDNELFRTSMHQDAHEFYGLVLNDVISNVETNAKRLQEQESARERDALVKSVENALGAANVLTKGPPGTRSPGTGWVHDIFEGVLTSETKCLTCETTSQRDETFLDLSIDLEEHSSVTSCLRKFSAEEMLCERNKFHCDHCGGLQEAEKRMKLKRLPKVLALHLKRFKYTEDYSRLQKLFHRVVYPYHLRMFNTTDDAEDPDRLYELYAVVVHIGGNAYHGHYVSVIKTEDRGWLLFDDEMVEPVDKHFVRNFFGDKPGMACAYVLFYQETTFEKVVAEQEAEGLEEVKLASQKADLALGNIQPNGIEVNPLHKHITQPQPPISPMEEKAAFITLNHAQTAPDIIETHAPEAEPPSVPAAVPDSDKPSVRSKDDKEREKKEAKAAEKARKIAEKEDAKAAERERKEREIRIKEARKKEADELRKALEASKQSAAQEQDKRKQEDNGKEGNGGLRKSRSMSMRRTSLGFLNKDKDKGRKGTESAIVEEGDPNGSDSTPLTTTDKPLKADKHHIKERFSFSLGRKKSTILP